MVYDVIIIGAGAAGCSAALTLRARGKSVLVVANAGDTSALSKAEKIDNYPGLPEIAGSELSERLREQIKSAGAELREGRVVSAASVGADFMVAIGSEVESARALIIATGITQKNIYPGEAEYLGKGVSYCATCDGMLYRNKRVAVLAFSADSEHETAFLREIGCQVELFEKGRAKKFELRGKERLEALVADGVEYPVDGVFILRDTVAVTALMPGLETKDGSISTGRDMSTSIPGVFAAGDCTGRPYQIAKAAGEGNIAALTAVDFLNTKES